MLLQATFGLLVVYSPGVRLLGGEARAKSLWKYHRMSGYILIILLFATVSAAGRATWIVANSNLAQQILWDLGLAAAFFGLTAKINYSKFGFGRK